MLMAPAPLPVVPLLTPSTTDVKCVSNPLLPVMVSVEAASGVLDDVVTVIVELPAPVTVAGANVTVAPAGCPLAFKFTPPLKPFNAPTFTVYVALLPAVTVAVPGVAATVKSETGGAVATIATDVECVSNPLLPVMASVEVASGVLDDVVTVIVELPAPVIVAGANITVAPAGCPLALKFTPPLKPFSAPTFTVYVALLPAVTVTVPGVAATVKSGTAGPVGTICIPFNGARWIPSLAVPGVAVTVNPVPLIALNFT